MQARPPQAPEQDDERTPEPPEPPEPHADNGPKVLAGAGPKSPPVSAQGAQSATRSAEARAQSADIREWAISTGQKSSGGKPVGDSGRLPVNVIDDYFLVHPKEKRLI